MNNPSYFSIIPANVRYAKNLLPNAKLLYAEITSLCSAEGYCYASDEYFAKSFLSISPGCDNVTVRTIRRWIKQLVDGGYIERVLIYDKKGGICGRRLYLAGFKPQTPENPVQYPVDTDVHRGVDTDVHRCGHGCPPDKDSNYKYIKTDRQTGISDDLNKNLEKEKAGACAREASDNSILDQNQPAYEYFSLSLQSARDGGANDGVSEKDFDSVCGVLDYLGFELACRREVYIHKKPVKCYEYLVELGDVLLQGERDPLIFSTIRLVCQKAMMCAVRYQFGYLCSALYTRLKLAA